MFGVTQEKLLESLKNLWPSLCAYISPRNPMTPHRCDCKYGITKESVRFKGEKGNGCPEIMLVTKLISSMTTEEYKEFCKRAGIYVHEWDNEKNI